MIKNNQENQIVVLLGASASGKDSLAGYFKEHGWGFVTSHTTRPMRENESQGNPYYFIDPNTMQGFINNKELIEYRVYDTILKGDPQKWYYGTHNDEIKPNEKYIVVLDLEGYKEFKHKFGSRVVGYYLEVPNVVRTERAMSRGSFCEEEWSRRLVADSNDFHWLKLRDANVEVIPFRWQTVEELYLEITEGAK